MEQNKTQNAHSLQLEDRKVISLSGVTRVDSFDEESIYLVTELGELVIKGSKLHVSRLEPELKEVCAEGQIDSLVYTSLKKKKGWLGRIFG